MSKVLLVSGRGLQTSISDCCAHDFEDCIIDATEADVFIAEEGKSPPSGNYDLVIVVGLNFRKLATTYLTAGMPKGRHSIGYVFGGYGSHTTRYRSPVKRRLNPRYRAMTHLDHIYVGIKDDVGKIQDDLSLPVSYLPMAADVLSARATPFESDAERPISVAAFGRVHNRISNAICDQFNTPGSRHIYLYNGVNGNAEPADKLRYRATFWHTLRRSRLCLAFDHFFANEKNTAEHSYVGPRWFEGLAAGTVIVGKAPPKEKQHSLLDWKDAAIDLSNDDEKAAKEILDLLSDSGRLKAASRENLANMNRRHDWRQRLADIYADRELPLNPKFAQRLNELDQRAKSFSRELELT